jgi:hypothetical protein
MGNQQNQTSSEGNPKQSGEKANLQQAIDRAEEQVRENEDASLQDDSYTFDSDNTDSEEGIDDFDISDVGGDIDDDYV